MRALAVSGAMGGGSVLRAGLTPTSLQLEGLVERFRVLSFLVPPFPIRFLLRCSKSRSFSNEGGLTAISAERLASRMGSQIESTQALAPVR